MKEHLKHHILVSSLLFSVAVAIVVGVVVAHFNQQKLERYLESRLREGHARMYVLAEITDRNGADEAIERIVSDCPRRNEYETLLMQLATLSKKDLLSVQNLFESCGSFYAERKALMVDRFEREFEHYVSVLDSFSLLAPNRVQDFHQMQWHELIQLEKVRSTLLTDQERLQKDIISALISGSSVHSKDVAAFVESAANISELLIKNDQQIDALRATLKE